MPQRQISLESIRDAAGAVYGAAIRTPLVRVMLPDDRNGPDGFELYLKLEVLQPIGSFKIRGAYNVVRQLTPDQLRDGVWTVSAGNAAQGVALAARKVGRALLGDGDGHRPRHEDSRHRAAWRVDRPGYLRRVLANGRGTRIGPDVRLLRPPVRRRSLHRRQRDGRPGDSRRPAGRLAIVAPLGGGGLLSGLAAATRALKPDTRVYAAEPETAAPLSASLAAGKPIYFDKWTASFVDGAGGKSVLATMWPLLSTLSGSLVVSLDEVARAMKLVAERTHVIAEGAAACAIAAALSGRAGPGKVVAVVSGGNIDLAKFAALVGACQS